MSWIKLTRKLVENDNGAFVAGRPIAFKKERPSGRTDFWFNDINEFGELASYWGISTKKGNVSVRRIAPMWKCTADPYVVLVRTSTTGEGVRLTSLSGHITSTKVENLPRWGKNGGGDCSDFINQIINIAKHIK